MSSQEFSLTGSLQTKRDLEEPYPSDATIFEWAKNFSDKPEEFSDLFKEDLIEATGLVARSATRNLEASPYLKALLHRGLKCNEVEEKIDPLVETSMMYTLVICYGQGPWCTGGCLPKALQASFRQQGGLISTKDEFRDRVSKGRTCVMAYLRS